MLNRRTFVMTSAGLVATTPFGARAQRAADPRVLRFVPQANLTSLDPIWTTAAVTSNHGYYVYDTLYGMDDALNVKPQMAEGHTVEDDGRTWLIRLREGLRFHDGEPVRAQDCAPSLERWSRRDTFGQSVAPFVEEWGAKDDRTIRIRLKQPFPLLIQALGKPTAVIPFIMPERIARTDPFTAIRETIGSGPYRFVADEYVSGSRVVYRRFDGYVPRQDEPQRTTGGKVANFERVEWQIIPDSATASAALQSGEVDWWEQVNPDLIPLLRRHRDVRIAVIDEVGYLGVIRFNHLHPPFDKAAMRRAILYAVNQEDYLRGVTGNDPEAFGTCASMWPCRTPYESPVANEPLTAPRDLDRAKRMIAEAGYSGERIVIINPSDFPTIGPFGHVTYDLFRRLGLNVELVDTDWGSVVQRRASREPVERGGWSIFHTWWPGLSIYNPAINATLRGQGDRGWFGWYRNDRVEQLTAEWLQAQTEVEQRRLADEIQRESFEHVPIVPLGRFLIRTAHRTSIDGLLSGTAPYPWNVRRV